MNRSEQAHNSATLLRAYHQMLEETVRGYTGRFHEIINFSPEIFKLFTNLLEDPRVGAAHKPLIFATIAYFVAPFDVISEEVIGPIGYLDDLFLCSWSLRKLEEEIGYAVLDNNWEGEVELSTVIDYTYKKSRMVIGGLEEDILEYFESWINRCSETPQKDYGEELVQTLLYCV